MINDHKGIKYSELRKHLKIELAQGRGNGLSFYTHYLHNLGADSASIFKKGALEFVDQQLHGTDRSEILNFEKPASIEWDIPFPPPRNPRFTFIDLFAGIGGFRIALQKAGGKCVFSSEWDNNARKTYEANFGEYPFGNIREIKATMIPDHDLLVAGFPCQPFSIAGVSKKNSLGRKHGFADETQGTLFYQILRILEDKNPSAILLENVKNLRSHDKKRTYRIILDSLAEAGYKVKDDILDARQYVPQHRERIFFIGFREKVEKKILEFQFPIPPRREPQLSSILVKKPDPKYTLSDHLWNYLRQYAEKHRARGNGFGYGLVGRQGIARTLSARYYKDGSEILVEQDGGRNPRRLTPEECKTLMGFPPGFQIRNIGVSDTQLYKQFGNSVAVPVVSAIVENLIPVMLHGESNWRG
jgi:DNA (cytosine-5)-methyltransferase 1